MTRFSICALIVDAKASTLINILIGDWIPPIGKPRRINTGAGSPGMFGAHWDQFIHEYAIQLTHAPRSASYQNGMAERAGRSLKEGLRAILTEEGDRPSQKILTQAAMARNHVPHTVTGIPPSNGNGRTLRFSGWPRGQIMDTQSRHGGPGHIAIKCTVPHFDGTGRIRG